MLPPTRATWKALLFFWVASFGLAAGVYYALRIVMPGGHVFGALYRMFLYHYSHPLPYIALVCFWYGIAATLFLGLFRRGTWLQRIGITVLIAILTTAVASPFGGMLWHYHDMQAGYFPEGWAPKMVSKGVAEGLGLGWLIVGLSIPYNLIGLAAAHFLHRYAARRFAKRPVQKL